MKALKWVMIASVWLIVFGAVFALSGRDTGGAVVKSVATYLPILLIAAVLYGIVAGVKKLVRR
ncbi:hypothetical protein [Devosia enhydra]|uniref:hypothetical protein n=1 Tax=Devosia enhydra TaxID=665118 RepID=UPI000930EEAB|nr:hypothetical protein [Devosia enhydra]